MTSALFEQIRHYALTNLEFCACGISSVHTIHHSFNKENYAVMPHISRHIALRNNPALLLEGVRSIVSVAMPYCPAQFIPPEQPQVAWYAYGEDYHNVVRRALKQLLLYIQSLSPEVKGRVCVDSAPVAEKYWAVRAGIGTVGKHTQLIVPRYGSLVVLGELLLTAECPAPSPSLHYQSVCGNCYKCVEACPTGALLGQGNAMNPSLCISYQTIENRSEIPTPLRSCLSGCIYGCNECNRVCPHNKEVKPTSVKAFHPKEQLLKMTCEEWESLTLPAFEKLFHGTPMHRTGYDKLMSSLAACDAFHYQKP